MDAEVTEIVMGADASAWERVGVAAPGGVAHLGSLRLVFDPTRVGIASLGVAGFPGDDRELVAAFDGLPVHHAERVDGPPPVHELAVRGIELISIATSSASRTVEALAAATGNPAGRVRDHGGYVMGYVSLGATQAEVVENADAPTDAATAGGLILIVDDVAAQSERLGPEVLSEPRLAVQFGRHIATFRPAAELGLPIAVMSPKPEAEPSAEDVQLWRERRAAARRG